MNFSPTAKGFSEVSLEKPGFISEENLQQSNPNTPQNPMNPQKFIIEKDLDLDNPVAKTLCLAQSVKRSLVIIPGHFTRSNDLYTHYSLTIPLPAQVSKVFFLKEIERFMAAYNIKPSRMRHPDGRGFMGLGIKHTLDGIQHTN